MFWQQDPAVASQSPPIALLLALHPVLVLSVQQCYSLPGKPRICQPTQEQWLHTLKLLHPEQHMKQVRQQTVTNASTVCGHKFDLVILCALCS